MGKCHICFEDYNGTTCQPKNMRCGHTFCLRCLQHLEPKKCPLCHTEFKMTELVPNYDIINTPATSGHPRSPAPRNTNITVRVKPITGGDYLIQVNTSDSVESLKKKLVNLTGIQVASQQLVYAGKPMDNKLPIWNHKVIDGHVIQMTTAFLGGGGGESSKM